MNSNSNNDSSGRTLNVPKQLKAGVLPNNTFNGGRTTGELCKGDHCSIPVIPKSIMLDKSPESNICLLIESNQID